MRIRSEEIYRQACRVIPGGVNSPVRAFSSLGIPPLIAERGCGAELIDADGRSYIDYCGSWGALILGHAHPEIAAAAVEQIHKGSTYGVATRLEQELAAKIVSLVPSIRKIRFVSTGTEACMTAVRLARGATGRPKIVKCIGCYHGHSDAFLVKAGSGLFSLNAEGSSLGLTKGAIADTISIPFNDRDAVRALFADPAFSSQIAALIVEPIPANMGVVLPEPGYLELLRAETDKAGALLIFDEVITGFRVGLQGAQGLYGVLPDLTCLGKIIGGGFPAAAVGGRSDVMNLLAPLGQVYQAGTLSGNPVAMAAGLKTLSLLEEPSVYERLAEKTRRLTGALSLRKARLAAIGSLFTLFVEDFSPFFRHLFAEGVYLAPFQQEASFVSIAHTNEQLDRTADAINRTLKIL